MEPGVTTAEWWEETCCICFRQRELANGRACRECYEHARKHCPEHGCKLRSNGTCPGCSSQFMEDDYDVFHHDIGDR